MGLCLNLKRSRRQPLIVTTFLGISLDSIRDSMSLTVEREQAFRAFLNQFRLHSRVSWGLSPPDGPHGSHGAGGSVSAPKHETSPPSSLLVERLVQHRVGPSGGSGDSPLVSLHRYLVHSTRTVGSTATGLAFG